MGYVQNVDISLPCGVESDGVARATDDVLARSGLTVALRDLLKKYPGCIHWHAKNGRASGTLEVTLWPQERRAWFTVQSGRRAPWIEEKLGLLSAYLQGRLSAA